MEDDVHAVDEALPPQEALRGEDAGDQEIASRRARDARELEEPCHRHAPANAAGYNIKLVTRREVVTPREALSQKDRVGLQEPLDPLRAHDLHVSNRAVAAGIDPQDLGDLARAVVDERRAGHRRSE